MAIGTAADFPVDDIRVANEGKLDDITPRDWDDYDFIVVGAESAGSAVAARLSEDPKVSVLLIEGGGPENMISDIPLFAFNLQLASPINWHYKMNHSPNYCRGYKNQQCPLARGKVMGGCSVLNFMIATRASYEDYDNWAQMGCEGWTWKDVYPTFRKIANFQVNEGPVEQRRHSKGGPLNIESAPYRSPIARVSLEAGKERGFVDYNGDEMIGYAYPHATIHNGSRFSTNQAYLYPTKKRPNLFVSKFTHTDRILIDRQFKRTYGVLMTKDNKKIRAIVKREVIVCAGAIGSPKLLMLSDIGSSAHLNDMNIRVLKEFPVGKSLLDHITYLGLDFPVNDTMTIVASKLMDTTNRDLVDYFTKRQGQATVPGGNEALGFFKVDEPSSRTGRPDMELILNTVSVGLDWLAHTALGIAPQHYRKYSNPYATRTSS